MTAINPLDYTPAPPRRKKWLRRGVLPLLVVATAIASYRWGPPAWRQVEILYWQRQCMEYSPSADTVVYEEEPVAAAKLLAHPAEYGPLTVQESVGPGHSDSWVSAAVADVHCLKQLAAAIAPTWGAQIAVGFNRAAAVAFLHERWSRAGHRRLISVLYFPDSDTAMPGAVRAWNYSVQVVTPATSVAALRLSQQILKIEPPRSWPQPPPLVRMFAGQPDPADPAHFTIRYQMWGQEDVLDGRLNDDDSVTLTPRHTPQEPR